MFGLVAINWKYIRKSWIERNSIEHTSTTQDQEEINAQKTIGQIERN